MEVFSFNLLQVHVFVFGNLLALFLGKPNNRQRAKDQMRIAAVTISKGERTFVTPAMCSLFPIAIATA